MIALSKTIFSSNQLSSLSRAGLLFITCCTGWLIMELEILGGRILSIYFGSSIYVVWGSVIGVFLLSLSAGYILGGWLSQKRNAKYYLPINLCIAAIWIFLVVYIRKGVCETVFSLIVDEKWGALTAALALFSIPTILLATITPMVICRLTKEADQSGTSSGIVFCISTIASFAGCIITAFYLISFNLATVFKISGTLLFIIGLGIMGVELLSGRNQD